MGAIVTLPNPFDFTEREVATTRRRMTVRQAIRHTQRRRTSVRIVSGRRVREFDKPTVCFFNGRTLMRADWSRNQKYQFFEYACHEGDEQVKNYVITSRIKRKQEKEAAAQKAAEAASAAKPADAVVPAAGK